MASFVDQIQQFNPYIQQLPVDEYTRAGIMKQEQYNAGVQQVQKQWDYIRGLPIAGDANKAVLEQKLSELKSKITPVLASDFSKASLVSQIGSMASKVANDPVIQKGLLAASHIQAWEKSKQESMKKDGKGYSAANAWVGDNAVQAYLEASKTQAGLDYMGPTQIHQVTDADVTEKITKNLREMKGFEDASVDITPQGNIEIKTSNKSIDKARFKTIIDGILSADDRVALKNAGMYQMKDMDDEAVLNSLKQHYGTISEQFKLDAETYEKAANTTAGISVRDKEHLFQLKENAQTQLGYYQKYIKDIEDNYNSGVFNREDLIGNFWTDKISEQLSRGTAFSQKDKDTKINPQDAYDLDLMKAETDRIKALADLQNQKGASGESLHTPLKVDPDKSKDNYNIGILESNIDKNSQVDLDRDDKEYREIAKELKYVSNGLYSYVNDRGEWQGDTPEEKQKSKKAAEKFFSNTVYSYSNAVSSGSDKVPEGMNKAILNRIGIMSERKAKRDAYLNLDKDSYNFAKSKDPKIAKGADPNTKITFKGLDGSEETYSLMDIKNIIVEGTELVNAGRAGTRYEIKDGSKYSDLSKKMGGSNKIQGQLAKMGYSIEKLRNLKNEFLSSKEEVINPMFVTFGKSEKERKDSKEFENYKNVIMNSDEITQIEKDKEGYVDKEKIDILGGYYDKDGRFKLRVQADIKDGTGKTMDNTTFDVDMTTTADEIKMRPDLKHYWIHQNFFNDSDHELTRLSKAGYTENMKFPVTSNLKANRYYRILPVPANKLAGRPEMTYEVIVERPGTASFKLINSFPNVGMAREAIEDFYARSGDNVRKNEEDYINQTKQ